MFDCNCLIHPFQNDPGTSQSQRKMEALLSDAVKIDARELADLLDYFVQMAKHINYYDTQMNIGDWQPFFKKSTPFILSAMIRYPVNQVQSNFHIYTSLFKKKPIPNGLQLISRFIYHHFIERVNNWHQALKETHLPITPVLEQLIRDKLQQPTRDFIGYANAATNSYDIKGFNFHALYENKVWNIDLPDIYAVNNTYSQGAQHPIAAMSNLYEQFTSLLPVFVENMRGLTKVAENSLGLSLLHSKEEYQEKHPPHLGLLFAFLSVFKELQNDLNLFTRKHLDFYYKNILNFKSAPAVGDQAHIVIELQQQLKKYILKKGTLVKAGKDDKKQEMLFGLDDEIAANKAALVDTKTLFLNNQYALAETYVEGVYMAPNAVMADGKELEFTGDVKNFPTLGGNYSKYIDPETFLVKPYPNARIGFILASPIFFLQGGSRKIIIKLACRLHDSICNDLGDEILSTFSNCCNEGQPVAARENPYPPFFRSSKFYDAVNQVLASTYYYLSEDLLKKALKNGVSKDFVDALRTEFKLIEKLDKVCYCPVEKRQYDNFLLKISATVPLTKEELTILDGLIVPVKALNVHFSGAEEWIEPNDTQITMSPTPLAGAFQFTLDIVATLSPDKDPITFYDKEKLGEDYNTTQPLAKIELDDRIKLITSLKDFTTATPITDTCCVQTANCCVQITEDVDELKRVSLYHFFRNVILDDATYKTDINVEVCGLKHLIVQNGESLLDINSPIMAFGTQPKVGSTFYIGSKEVFAKNWQDFWVNVEWKDRPQNFGTHYKHYNYVPFEDGTTVINNSKFKFIGSLLDKRDWKAAAVRRLFKPVGSTTAPFCNHPLLEFYQDVYHFTRGDFGIPAYEPGNFVTDPLKPLNIDSSYGFLRMTLDNMGFQHDRYAFVIARHMIALAGLVDPLSIKKAIDNLILAESLANSIQNRVNQIIPRINNIQTRIAEVIDDLTHNEGNVLLDGVDTLIAGVNQKIIDALGDLPNVGVHLAVAMALIIQIENRLGAAGQNNTLIEDTAQIKVLIDEIDFRVTNDPDGNINTANLNTGGLQELVKVLRNRIADMKSALKVNQALQGGLPKEPYTPIIKVLSIDYTAKSDNKDVSLIHLYPFEGTYRNEEITQQPSLFPRYCDEGNLFLGFNDLVPGDNLNLLFQLAEATADSESEKETVNWHYLDSNIWKPLRAGFEVLDDATENLTTSGIVKLALPYNMTNENTVMPPGQYWIKASIPKNSAAVSETTGIHPQAIKVSFVPNELNDTARLSVPIPKGEISKLNAADPAVSGIEQPYESFGGRVPEGEGHFYTRVSEILRHKGRAIQAWDYERLVLEAFPQVFKAKCINHSFALNAHKYKTDFPYAPGYVLLAVIPDLYKLKAGNSFEPKVPISILEKIEGYFKKRTSPFVRFRAMNPRYEQINFCIRVQLYPGKDENYYKEKLRQDLREFLAPWSVGKYDKLTFGQCVYRSGIVQFLEQTGYVDFITDLKMWKGDVPVNVFASSVCPDTARSILVAGDIEVCIEEIKCEKPGTYTGCEGIVIEKCNNAPIPVMRYCK